MDQHQLSDLLSCLTIAELKARFSQMGLKFKSNVRKQQMINGLSQWLLKNPEIVMDSMLTYELRLYEKIINNPEKAIVIPYQLNRWPFDDTGFNRGGIYSYIATDLAERLRPLLADRIAEREKSGEEAIENKIVGLINLRGAISIHEFDDILKEKGFGIADQNKILQRFIRFIAGNDENSDIVIESPFIEETDFDIFDDSCVDPDVKPKKFTERDIAKAASMPFPEIGSHARDLLKAKLRNMGKSDDEINVFLLDLWLDKEGETFNLSSILEDESFSSLEELHELVGLLTNFSNNVPFWRFKGWSSQEIYERGPKLKPGQIPHITMGPNLRARGIQSFKQLQEMAIRGEEIPDQPIGEWKNVGRNDPCPCGSGKKYKHCCGR